MIADVLHFSFTVRDIERSVDWYTQSSWSRAGPPTTTRECVHAGPRGYPRCGARGRAVQVADGEPPFSTHMLELIEYVEGADDRELELRTNMVGVPDLPLLVTDIDAKHEQMTADGVVFPNPPVEITAERTSVDTRATRSILTVSRSSSCNSLRTGPRDSGCEKPSSAMEFLVRIEFEIPPARKPATWTLDAPARPPRARELARTGTLFDCGEPLHRR